MFSRLLNEPLAFVLTLPCILLALSGHEFAHGWMAWKLGDPTARNLGRLTLNPLKHLDPVGTLCMVFFGFGWARPVPINPRYFKNNRRDFALTALAGPVANFIMAFLGLLLAHILFCFYKAFPPSSDFGAKLWKAFLTMAESFAVLNVSLGVFNLIPVPPLDGSRIFLVWLPAKYYFGVMKYERYIQIGLLILLWTGLLSKPLTLGVNWIIYGMDRILTLFPFFR
jgi:Zn-dependent protease